MGWLGVLRVCGWTLFATVSLLVGGVLVFTAGSLAGRGEPVGAAACGVLALVPLGPGVTAVGEALRVRRESRDPLAALPPVRSGPGFWSTLGRIRLGLLVLSFGLALTALAADALSGDVGPGPALFALLTGLLGIGALGIGLSLLANRGYRLWDRDDSRYGRVSTWRGSKWRW
ncbi:hypothetical protein E0L36_17785 [Streptomyces sp. AJS327]|uniref:hypothetical protein n=1 Tax=Streptomyces sp. AJS327 TaxID=2545265 RepID=UPI0015DF4D65|nr:hypothetical protein [Streptomyces sp. AJS327]MBA0052666.1 hypothetical protein [Streptomyces sp. AJS327]